MNTQMVGLIAALALAACSKPAGDIAPASSSSKAAGDLAPASSLRVESAATRPGAATCPLAQEIATSWCERRLQGCKETSVSVDKCKDAFLSHTTVGGCKGTDADKKACLAAVSTLPCESFKVVGANVPAACTSALQ